MLDNKEINIQIINRCQLKCKFCARSWVTLKELNKIERDVMSQETFEQIIDHCIDSGKTRFCLTPRMGELFLDSNIMDKLYYLENKPEVEYYFFATNLLGQSKHQLTELLNLTKAYIEVSMYGPDSKTFYKNTTRLQFDKFMDQLRLLYIEMFKNSNIFNNFTFFIRWNQKWNDTFPNCELFNILNKLELGKECIISDEETHNFNFGGLIPYGSLEAEYPSLIKNGICPTAYTGCIMPNGDVGTCYMNDVFNTMIIGNLYEDTLSNILQSPTRQIFLNNMSNGIYSGICEKCNEEYKNE
jgi:radical SAM protein with 4Fe4S-binding SPASM domain